MRLRVPSIRSARRPAFPLLAASVTNAVAFVAAWPGSAVGSRTELRIAAALAGLGVAVRPRITGWK